MGEVVDIGTARAARTARVRAVQESVPDHPALRWLAGDQWWLAHRRQPGTGAACGAPGELVHATRGVPLCGACYPPAAESGRP